MGYNNKYMQWYKSINSPDDAVGHLTWMRGQTKEHCVGLYLDSRNRLIDEEIISIGTIQTSIIHPREVFEPAIRKLSSGLLVTHNHPSGDCTPSDADDAVTKRLIQVGELMGIPLVDHLILTLSDWFSYRQQHPGWFSRQSGVY